MADTPWIGRGSDKLYLTSGVFSSTIKTSQDISGIAPNPAGISYDGTNTPWCESTDRLHLQSGQFTSTLKTSLSPSNSSSFGEDVSWDGTNTPNAGGNTDKLYLTSGQFVNTLKDSEDISAIDANPKGISWDGTNTPWCGDEANKLYLHSGQFTSTLKTSASSPSSEPTGISWNGVDTLNIDATADKMYLVSGQFTTTIKTSQATTDTTPHGICTNDVNARLGIAGDIDLVVNDPITTIDFRVLALTPTEFDVFDPVTILESSSSLITIGVLFFDAITVVDIPSTAILEDLSVDQFDPISVLDFPTLALDPAELIANELLTVAESVSTLVQIELLQFDIASLLDSETLDVTAILWDERFEGTGYENVWSEGETVNPGATLDEDAATTDVNSPAFWDSQALKAQIDSAANPNAFVEHAFSQDYNRTFTRIEFIVTAEGFANTEGVELLLGRTLANDDLFAIWVVQDIGVLDLWVYIFHDGTSNIFEIDGGVSLNTKVRVEIGWNSIADTWEWRLNGTTQNSGSLTGAAVNWGLGKLSAGARTADNSVTCYIDNIQINLGDFPGAPGFEISEFDALTIVDDPTLDFAFAGVEINAFDGISVLDSHSFLTTIAVLDFDAVTIADIETVETFSELKIDAIRVAAKTSGAPTTQQITIAGFGTPKAAIVMVTYGVTDNVVADHGVISIGFTDGTNHRCEATSIQHNVTATNTHRVGSNTSLIRLVNPTTAATDGVATFSQWVTDGIEINWSSYPAGAYLVSVLLLGGRDIDNVLVGDFTQSATLNGTIDVATGFEPSLILGVTNGASLNDTISAQCLCSLGIATGSGTSVTNRCATIESRDNQNPSKPGSAFAENRFTQNIFNNAVSRSSQITEIYPGPTPAAGFQVTTRDAAISLLSIYMAVRVTNHLLWLDTIDSPTVTGNQSYTGPGFRPQALMALQTARDDVGLTATGSSGAGTFGFGISAANQDLSATVADSDNVSPTDSGSLSDDQFIHVKTHDQADEIKATLVSFDATGFTLNWSDVLASGRKFAILAFQESSLIAEIAINQNDSILVDETRSLALDLFEVDVFETVTSSEFSDEYVTPLEINPFETISTVDPELFIGPDPMEADVFDALLLAESMTLEFDLLIVSLFEVLTALDDASVQFSAEGDLSIDQFEALTALDIVSAFVFPLELTPFESVTTVEAETLALDPFEVSASDAVSVLDIETLAVDPSEISEAEAITVVDADTLELDPLLLSEVETISVLDIVSAEIGEDLTINAVEAISLAEDRTLEFDLLLLSEFEAVTVAENATLFVDPLEIVSQELLSSADVSTLAVDPALLSIFETITVIDSPNADVTPLIVDVADAVTALDVLTADLSENLALNEFEAVGVTESATAAFDFLIVSLVEALTITEAETVVVDPMELTPFETVSLAEFLALVFDPLEIVANETITLAELRTVSLFVAADLLEIVELRGGKALVISLRGKP